MSNTIETAGRVVVGTDTSEAAANAIRWAAGVAARRQVPLLIVTVNPLGSQDGPFAEENLAKEAEHIRAEFPELTVETAVTQGEAADVLVAATKDADMVVVGARGASAPIGVRTLGGYSDAVATHGHGPVAVVPEDALVHDGPLVVGVDDSAESRAAVRVAFRVADRDKLPLVALRAHKRSANIGRTYHGDDAQEIEHQAIPELHAIVDPVAAEYPNVKWEPRVVSKHPVWALVDASKGASVVVVGSRGRGGFLGLLLGSTSRELLRHAESPVVVVRPDAR